MARPSATRPVSGSRFPTRTPTLGWTSPHEAPSVEHVWSCRAPRSNRHVTANMIMKIYAVTMDGQSTNSAAHVAPLRQPRANHLDDGDVHESTPPARTVGRADRPTVRGGARPTRTTIPPLPGRPLTRPAEFRKVRGRLPPGARSSGSILAAGANSAFTSKGSQKLRRRERRRRRRRQWRPSAAPAKGWPRRVPSCRSTPAFL